MPNFPTNEYLQASKAQYEREQYDPMGEAFGSLTQGIGSGMVKGVDNRNSQEADARKLALSDYFKNNMVVDSQGQPATPDIIQKVYMGGKLPDGYSIAKIPQTVYTIGASGISQPITVERGAKVIPEPQATGTQFQQTPGGIEPVINPMTQKPMTTKDKILPSEDSKTRGFEQSTRMGKKAIVDKFNSNHVVTKAMQSMNAAKQIRDLIESNNPIAAAAIPTYSARMSGEVGNLSEPDKKPFGGSRAIDQRLKQTFEQMATGRLTEDNKQFMRQLTDVIINRSKTNYSELADMFSKQYSQTGYGETKDIYNMLDVFQDINPTPTAQVGMTPEKMSRLQELRAKKAAGTLK